MTPLNFFITPMSADMKMRTLLAHNARGIARYITTSHPDHEPAHPLAFSFVLGLGNKLEWYSEQPAYPSVSVSQQLMLMISGYGRPRLHTLDCNMLALRLGSMPSFMHDECLDLVYSALMRSKEERKMQSSDKIPADVMSKLEMSLASLEKSLLEKDPMMPQHLRNSHSVLVSYPETVHLLDDKEIAMLIDAAEIHTKTEIVKATVKKGTGTRKKIEAGDL